MKRLLALAAVALVLLSVPVAISLQFPRQVDPSSAPTDQVYGQGLYLFYGSVVAALSGGNFTAAEHLLRQSPFVHVPAEILDAYDSFNGELNTTAAAFRSADLLLANASGYISSGQVAQARASLQGAIGDLRGANQTLTQLFGAEPQLAALTGIPSSLLLSKLQPLQTLYSTYSAEADRLVRVITGLTRLELPTVTLNVTAATMVTGSDLSFSGRLSGPGGAPLASKEVTLYFGDRAIGNVTTDGLGGYAGTLPTPLYYQHAASVFSSYVPTGNDSLVYSPATSAAVSLNVTFSTPTLAFQAPGSVYAGGQLAVTGSATLAGLPLDGYGVSLSGLGASALLPPQRTSGVTSQAGAFSLDMAVPTGLAQGTYQLTLATGANGTVGPSTSTLAVRVIKENPSVRSSAPIIAFAGFPVTITGSATANGTGVSGARVLNVTPSPSVNATTSQGGTFSFSLTPPATASNGYWTYTAEVYPSQSWISPASVNVTLFVINPLILVLPFSSVGVLAFVVRRRREPLRAQALAAGAPVVQLAAAGERPPLAGVPLIYAEAVKLVERSTSTVLQPQMTVREYLGLVRGTLKGVKHFEYISGTLESHLYGPGVVPEVEGRAAEELEQLREELEG